MWQNPHVLILDEPTNDLDREGLGTLVQAIKDYKGCVHLACPSASPAGSLAAPANLSLSFSRVRPRALRSGKLRQRESSLSISRVCPRVLLAGDRCSILSRASVRELWAGRSRSTGAMTGHRLDRRAVVEEAVCPPVCWTSEEGQPAALPEEDRWQAPERGEV